MSGVSHKLRRKHKCLEQEMRHVRQYRKTGWLRTLLQVFLNQPILLKKVG